MEMAFVFKGGSSKLSFGFVDLLWFSSSTEKGFRFRLKKEA
jgi:hypothetical protein